MTTQSRSGRLTSLVGVAIAVVTGCGDQIADPSSGRGESTISISADVSATTAGLSVEITAADIDPPIVQNIPIVANVAAGTVTIPAGSDRTLTVRAFDTGAIETHRGSRTIDVVEGANLEVTFTLEPLVGDVPIVVNTATYVVTLDATTIALATAGTHQLSATVTDAAGVVSAAAVTWGSRNPVIASVDQTGRVTGGVLGTTSVVAHYRRVVAVVPVTVQAAAPVRERLVFVRQATPGAEADIYVANADGTGVTQLTGAGRDAEPAWSPDGTRIAFASDRADFWEIFVMNADGTGEIFIAGGSDPAWSPDGIRIVYPRPVAGTADLWIVNADGTGNTELLNAPTPVFAPDWSPDGTRIAFVQMVPSVANPFNRDIMLINNDGTGVTPLVAGDAVENTPAWSPDGSRVAFQTDRDGNFEIYVINADGTGLTRLTTDPAWDGEPAWSPDGSRIVFRRDTPDQHLFVMNADGTGVTQLTSGTSSNRTPDWTAVPVSGAAASR